MDAREEQPRLETEIFKILDDTRRGFWFMAFFALFEWILLYLTIPLIYVGHYVTTFTDDELVDIFLQYNLAESSLTWIILRYIQTYGVDKFVNGPILCFLIVNSITQLWRPRPLNLFSLKKKDIKKDTLLDRMKNEQTYKPFAKSEETRLYQLHPQILEVL